MEAFDKNAGTNRLAVVLSRRMKMEGESAPVIDFGEIKANGSLVTNMFPVAVPRGDYTVCRHAACSAGDRVLVAWVNSEAVVVGVLSGQ